jgi:phosphoribosylformylglycinamidine (FGAM) synthase-like amidotransferase family enzyme
MAFAFNTAGFSAVDVHMTDIISGRVSLSTFAGLAACGGFSYGDVLGAGQGWALTVNTLFAKNGNTRLVGEGRVLGKAGHHGQALVLGVECRIP